MVVKTRNIEAIESLVIDDVIDSNLTLSECYSIAGGFPFTVRAAGAPPSDSSRFKIIPTGAIVVITGWSKTGKHFACQGDDECYLIPHFRRWQLVRSSFAKE